MIYPIVAYGDPVLRKKAVDIEAPYPNLPQLISDMYDTMYKSQGVGLAAPQIGLSIRLFVVDATPFKEDEPALNGFKRVFINPVITKEDGKLWKFNEGCLSIPGIREDVERNPVINITYSDENFKSYTEQYDGILARIIQHEYDHLEGILFTDKLTPLKKKMLKGKLAGISKGIVDVDYKMRFFKK